MKPSFNYINSTAPVRICDIGGWTDTWFSRHGAVFNVAVTPCVEVKITTSPVDREERLTLNLGNYNESYSLNPDKIQYSRHPLIEATIDSMEIPPEISLQVNISSEIPSGASVGTSAAVCVALVGALDALTPGRLTAQQVASLALRVEIEKLQQQSGIQDQLCCAYGGINYIHMPEFPRSILHPLTVTSEFQRELGKRLTLFYIGSPHNSSEVHKMVIADLGKAAHRDSRINRLRQLAAAAREAVVGCDFIALGEVMNQNTQVQRELHPGLVCPKFEELMEIANFHQAAGCKVNGAGGDGGSVTVLGNGNEERQREMSQTLKEKGFTHIPISLSAAGLRVTTTKP